MAEHGTPARYRKHSKAGEKPCAECRRAWRIYCYAMERKRAMMKRKGGA